MYAPLLHLHNVTRWLVLIAGVVAIAFALHGLLTRRSWDRASRIGALAFVGILDLQVVLGLVLYVVSPLVRGGLADIGTAMGTFEVRFFVLEHALLMIVAAVVAHIGSVAARRAATDRARHARALGWFTAAMLLVVLAIPWWRPLLPGMA